MQINRIGGFRMEKRLEIKQYTVPTVLLVCYLVFNGILLIGHEMWRDEANVWLIARDMTPLQLLREIKYQGHPCLWYLIAMPFAKLGFPFKTLSVLSFLIMGVAAAFFCYKGPFCAVTKAVILLSPIMTYYYPVVARNYCLIACFLILLACFYPKRNEKRFIYGLFLGLLVQADTIALAPAGLISCMWLWECVVVSIRQKSKKPLLTGAKGLWIPLASLGLWVLQFYQVSDSPEYQMRVLSVNEMLREMKNFSYHILTRMTGQGERFGLLLILLFGTAGILLSLKRKNVWPAIVMAGAFLFEVVFSVMVYQLHIWHYIALCYSLIWCFWIYRQGQNNGEKAEGPDSRGRYMAIGGRVLAESLLIILGITMFLRWNSNEESSSFANAWNGLYSDGVHVAEYMKEHVSTDDVVLSTDVVEAATVQAYLGKEYTFYYAGTGETATYADYTEEQSEERAYEELFAWISKHFPDKEYVYLLKSPTNCVHDIPDEVKAEWELCYETAEKTARGEEYSLYRITL